MRKEPAPREDDSDARSSNERAQRSYSPSLGRAADAERARRGSREAGAQRDARDEPDAREARDEAWRSVFGVASRDSAQAPTEPASIREATLDYLADQGAHDASEDLHPSRLDHVEAKLEDALDVDARRKKNEAREARDA